jgi:hypothetical protein
LSSRGPEIIFDEIMPLPWQRQEYQRLLTRTIGTPALAGIFYVQEDGVFSFTPAVAMDGTAATRRATDAQVLEDAEHLIGAWSERQALRAPMIFSPTIGAAIKAGYWFLWVRCPACQTINAIDLRTLDRHHDAAVTSLIPSLSCRSCRPNAPFAELVRLSRTSVADEMREEHRRRVLGE